MVFCCLVDEIFIRAINHRPFVQSKAAEERLPKVSCPKNFTILSQLSYTISAGKFRTIHFGRVCIYEPLSDRGKKPAV